VRTLYLRNVPDEMAEAFVELAKREGMSVNAFVLRELAHIARRARNASVLAEAPDATLSVEDVVNAIREQRGDLP
jgi:hypothetical protein